MAYLTYNGEYITYNGEILMYGGADPSTSAGYVDLIPFIVCLGRVVAVIPIA